MSAGEEQSALQMVLKRVEEKQRSYRRYNFSEAQNAVLRTFFDLAQEYDSMEDFYRVCVAVPRVMLGLKARLYLLNERRNTLQLICDSESGLVTPPEPVATTDLSCRTRAKDDSLHVPIQRKPSPYDSSTEERSVADLVLGRLEIAGGAAMDKADRFFLRKYANRIGYNLHNRLIAQQNIRHLRFINNLVTDIEHNVITPNMYFRHLFNKLRKRLAELEEVSQEFSRMRQADLCDGQTCGLVQQRLELIYDELAANHREMQEHYNNYSLFLESLFRRDHFRKGHLVLRPRACSIEKEVIAPQLEHYGNRLVRQGIKISQPRDMAEEEITLRVDVGLLSQVYANFFSNAVKYTSSVHDHNGETIKLMAYGREYLSDYFGPGKDGVKFNVFTTGEHLSEREAQMLFSDGFRGEAGQGKPGTGHGLAFIKQVVEIHGGVVGYEPTAMGNNFYFILPLSPDEA
ncbi:sensor histidine kinase [Desulfurivibrio alkaliphilus]|uniref:histidine kinase n=1 Tax=Desulfurivibrio alkaliphilus (strain DSM 19089 / UNIQEM U267 / AHT2) TaxID=589865 RepID=D6Z0I0_DESAT|nr:HAMP domain-containing sensor histidine kinase [Desulfurivibrio alkaliphilus]ADH85209.1 histidine kinase [Desulfurivibrio alkaliphilus AHT 2]